MGRGFSTLEAGILRLASDRAGMVRITDVLKVLWGWPAKPGKEQYDGGQVFVRASIGGPEYDKAYSTLSRSVRRLEKRGLLAIYKNISGGTGTAIALTPAGAEAAGKIKWVGEEEE